jgi:hypothetical protein
VRFGDERACEKVGVAWRVQRCVAQHHTTAPAAWYEFDERFSNLVLEIQIKFPILNLDRYYRVFHRFRQAKLLENIDSLVSIGETDCAICFTDLDQSSEIISKFSLPTSMEYTVEQSCCSKLNSSAPFLCSIKC